MSITYRNTITGRVTERDNPDRLMDRSERWERVEQESAAPFNPSEHGVHEVNNYLAKVDGQERGRVLSAEIDGKQRSTILEGPHAG